MHIAPFAHLICSYDIVVGHVHASGIGCLAVNDDYLAMVAWPDMVHPGESYWVELHNIDTVCMKLAEVMLLQRLIVGVVAKPVEHRLDFYTFLTLLLEQFEKEGRYGVVAEIEVLQMDTALGLTYGLKHIGKLVFT